LGTEEHGIKKPDLYVIARFLERLWTADRPIKKTRLQMAVGLNYGTFKRYLNWMMDRGLVTSSMEDDGSEYVLLTAKGLESYDQIVVWINQMIPQR